MSAATQPPEEYGSITVSIDHLNNTDRQPGDPVVCKTVKSTETAFESLMAQVDYFDMLPLLRDTGVFANVAASMDRKAVYILTVSQDLTNIIVDWDFYRQIVAAPELGNGTELGADGGLIVMATEALRAAKSDGAPTRLLVFLPDAG